MSITPRDFFFATPSSYLTFRFRDYTSDCGALTLGISQLAQQQVCDSKIKRSFQSAANENEAPEPPERPITKNMNIKLCGGALRWKAITLSLQCRCFTDTCHIILSAT